MTVRSNSRYNREGNGKEKKYIPINADAESSIEKIETDIKEGDNIYVIRKVVEKMKQNKNR